MKKLLIISILALFSTLLSAQIQQYCYEITCKKDTVSVCYDYFDEVVIVCNTIFRAKRIERRTGCKRLQHIVYLDPINDIDTRRRIFKKKHIWKCDELEYFKR